MGLFGNLHFGLLVVTTKLGETFDIFPIDPDIDAAGEIDAEIFGRIIFFLADWEDELVVDSSSPSLSSSSSASF